MDSRSYYKHLVHLRDTLDENQKASFDEYFFRKRKNQTHIFVTSVFVGDLGIDRMAMGQVWLGILKLITFGGLGIWTLVDYFLIGSSARSKNILMATNFVTQLKGVSHDGE